MLKNTSLLLILILASGCLAKVKIGIVKEAKVTDKEIIKSGVVSSNFPIGNKLTFDLAFAQGGTVDSNGNMILVNANFSHIVKTDSKGSLLSTIGDTSGVTGTNPSEFNYPVEARLDPSGNLFVLDKNNNRVQKFDPTGAYLFSTGSYGAKVKTILSGTFNGMHVDKDNNYFYVDGTVKKIFKFSSTGESLLQIGGGSGNYLFTGLMRGIKTDSQGNIYIIDVPNNRVQVYDEDGVWVRSIGSGNPGPAQISSPVSLAFDSHDNLFLTDNFHNKILKFANDGTYIDSFGSSGSLDGEFNSLAGIVFDEDDNMFIADGNNYRIQKFDSAFNHLQTIGGTRGTGAGEFNAPSDISLDSAGNIYVHESQNRRVQKLSPLGVHIGFFADDGSYAIAGMAVDQEDNIILNDIWNRLVKINQLNVVVMNVYEFETDKAEGKFDRANDIAVDKDGNFYVVDLNQRVQKFDSSGNFLMAFGYNGVTDGYFSNPSELTVDNLGNIFVADDRNRVQKFDSNGIFVTSFITNGFGPSMFTSIDDLCVDGSNNVYVLSWGDRYFQKFDNDGVYLGTFGETELQNATTINVDSDGMIIIFDGIAGVLKYNPDGSLAERLSARSTATGFFDESANLEQDSFGNLYTIESNLQRVQKFSRDGKFLKAFSIGVGAGVIRLDPEGNIWVLDWNNYVVKKFDQDGNHLLNVGGYGSADGEFDEPADFDFDSTGNLYVLDLSLSNVQKFDSNGNFISKFGSYGAGNGEFDYPTNLTIGKNNIIHIADVNNLRIQSFQTDGTYLSQFAVPYLSSSPITVDDDGNLYLFDSNQTVEKVTSTGIPLMQIIGGAGMELGSFQWVSGLSVDPANGNIHIFDANNYRIQRFSPTGALLD